MSSPVTGEAAGEKGVLGPPGGELAPIVVACMKLVELRARVDPLSGAVVPDPLSAGPSAADEAALEWALRIAEVAGGRVVAISAGGAQSEQMLRGAIAAGAAAALRVPLGGGESSALVATALAGAVRRVAEQAGCSLDGALPVVVCCGDASIDRGSGSVPGFLAGELAGAQALGLVGLTMRAAPGAGVGLELEVERRLDRGRRERLRLRPPCVISVESVTARLRRASLVRTLASATAEVAVLEAPPDAGVAAGAPGVELLSEEPFRPRTRLVPPPAPGLSPRARILHLTGALHGRPVARSLVLGPEEAADELLATLAEWGELPGDLLPRLLADEPAAHDETETP